MSDLLRIGTRGSALALAQAELTELALAAAFPELKVERVVISTTGDKRLDLKLANLRDSDGKPLDKGVFTKELELALEAGVIDVAVHSAKDVPTELPPGMAMVGALERANVEDVLVVAGEEGIDSLVDLPQGARVATSSVRRASILRWRREDLQPRDIRGNVQTRLRKLAESGGYEAMVLARAGLERLGMDPASGKIDCEGRSYSCAVLSLDEMLCAAGQGVVAFEIREGDQASRQIVEGITHANSWAELRAERALLHGLQAGCQTPVGARALVDKEGISMQVEVFEEDGAIEPRLADGHGPSEEPEALGAELARRLLG